ncbi:DUF2971 domain-containing protein [Clostridium sp. BNL1100]|uniref:DUF2971 domain-containing protein n=1 Tax=Clostridium sp. BNL1100 TaxID=755731 RepID=UPI00024A7F20|nr:DUF2971 domain-containing protein [Clostridium sp. BNL1100]AEY65433.1 Protein of unknown function (DUF2971) [Clostridium sp. BNL1100]
MDQDNRIHEFLCKDDSDLVGIKFHYTSPEGLKSIIDNSIFRFTDCQFLNDKSEYIHIEKSLTKVLEQIEGTVRSEIIEIAKNVYTNDFNVEESIFESECDMTRYNVRYFVFCSSNNNDLLNMWNHYVKNSKYIGYNIGFNTQEMISNLSKIEGNIEIFHGNVVYTENEQIDILKNYLISMSNLLSSRLQDANSTELEPEVEKEMIYDSTEQDIFSHLQLFRLFFKDKAFIHENEYRFVIKVPIEDPPTKQSSDLHDFSLKNGIFAPFINVKFDKNIVKNITVSPTIEYSLAKDGLNRYLKLKGYDNLINITKSIIPIRY